LYAARCTLHAVRCGSAKVVCCRRPAVVAVPCIANSCATFAAAASSFGTNRACTTTPHTRERRVVGARVCVRACVRACVCV
jgi:hypothetical protein